MSLVTSDFHPETGPAIEAAFARHGAAAETMRGGKSPRHYCKALIDTGADLTGFTKDVADALGIVPNGKRRIRSVHGSENSNYYYADIFIPVVNVWFQKINVIELGPEFSNFDALLGRDILCKGRLVMDGINRTVTFGVPTGSPKPQS